MYLLRSITFVAVIQLTMLASATATARSSLAEHALGAVIFYGASAFNHDQLLDIYSHLLGQPVTDELHALLEQGVQRLYRDAGILRPVVHIAADSEYGDLLVVDVLEPRIGYMDLLPRTGKAANKVRRVVNDFTFSAPLQQRDLEDLLSALRRVDGVSADAEFRRREGEQAIYDLYIEADPVVKVQMGFSNEGGQLLGPDLASLDLQLNSPGPLPFSAAIYGSKTIDTGNYEQYGVAVEHDLTKSLSAYLSFNTSDASLNAEDQDSSDRRFETESWRLLLFYELIESLRHEWDIYLSCVQRDHLRKTPSEIELDQRLNMLALGVNYGYSGRRVDWHWRSTVTRGINDFGAGHDESTFFIDQTDIDFLRWETGFTAWISLFKGLTARLDLGGQYTNDTLPISQTFALGGSSFVRAYEPGEFAGDRGVGGTVEIRRSFKAARKTRVIPYGYYGIGQVSSNSLLGSNEQSASSAGLGLRFRSDSLRIYIEADQPLTATSVYKNDDPRVNAGLVINF